MKFTGGLPETVCGAGSTLKLTATIRAELPQLLRQLGITRLLDAPCGDFNWMRHVDLTGIKYAGMDSSRENLALAIGAVRVPQFVPSFEVFFRGDILRDDMPPADAILCRDFFQHLPGGDVLQILARIKIIGHTWLLATSFDNQVNVPQRSMIRLAAGEFWEPGAYDPRWAGNP
jgi:SAM-dependent methyltransferase